MSSGRPSARLAVTVTTADGVAHRWGPDEFDPDDVPAGLSFTTQMPGGFGTCTLTLPRRIDIEWPDLNLFDTVTVYGPGGQVAWEGRVTQLPRQHAGAFSIQVGCVGWAAHLKDDPFFREVYVDRDLSHWGQMGLQRRINVAGFAGTPVVVDPAASEDSSVPALRTPLSGQTWTASDPPWCDAWYSAGVAIGSLYYAWKIQGIDYANAVFQWFASLADDDVATSFDITADLRGAGPGTGTLTATAANREYAIVQCYSDGVYGTASEKFVAWTCLAVYGSHGLTKQGTASATSAQGFYVSDMVANIVSRAAPLLNYTADTIAQTSFVVEQAEFRAPVTADEAILKLNAYHLWDFAVWENRTFWYGPTNPDRLCWEARLSDGAHLDLEGSQADTVYNGVVVTYTDPAGQSKTVGPTGSGADNEAATLIDTTESNPVNAAGITRKWGELSVTGSTTLAGATQLGAVWLAERSLPQRRGTLKVTGHIQHPTKGWRPTWEPRAGDYVRISDHPNDVKRRIIETSYSHDSREVVMSLDNSVFKLTAMVDRLGIIPT